MAELPVVGAQLTVLDIDKHRDWLFEKNRDLELPEFCMADILRAPGAFVDMAKDKLDGWKGRLGIHGPFAGFELDTKDRDMRTVVQTRLDQALDVCAALDARQMVLHSPFDLWDVHNFGNGPKDLDKRVTQIMETLGPALRRAEALGVMLVLENIKDVDPAHRAAVIDAAGSASLRLSVDTGHANWAHVMAGAPAVDRFITQAGDMLGHVHLQDTDGYADRHWPLGQGTIAWHGVFEALKRCKSDPHLIVEINDFDRVQESVAHLERLGLAQ
ncbi:sugar phosphate isomerase/epimerase family protein [Shimia aestuarii]|uniref:Sugar phosphate isomerase/epimerase n=1 Tax=Shimia aestuarii TaxID=254406 RepID=A0A1I4RYJ1_9RHOB|nr:sugar phosphate isomerase/epimerase family protein [Shimia aestuarii]SFM57023.1 Sugar phosphate isomerase/epimerase [Shimia aestuarii]